VVNLMGVVSLLLFVSLPVLAGVCTQVYVYRSNFNRTVAGSIIIGFGVGCIPLIGIGYWLREQISMDGVVAVMLIYLCAGYSFFHANNMGETSRRVRISLELANAPEGLTYEQILNRYNSNTQVQRRLARLLEAGDIEQSGTAICLKKRRILVMYYVVYFFKHLVFGSTNH
tara:strand:+ start:2466 stop:2978 length:513 start_codon:yes stop_codon:yes gene_type:complete